MLFCLKTDKIILLMIYKAKVMRIGRFFLVACLALIATTGYSQIGVNKRGVSANATAEFNVTNKGILLPRVDIKNRYENNPIVGEQKDMPDGLVVIDVHDKEESTLSFWNNKLNGEKGAWEQLANFDRLPKTAIIGFELVDKTASSFEIPVTENGQMYLLNQNDFLFKILNDGHISSLSVLDAGKSNEIQLGFSSGVYLIEFFAVFIAPKEANRTYYNMAYFTNFNENYVTSLNQRIAATYRVERSTFSPEGEEHLVVFSNIMDLKKDKGKEVLHNFSLGVGKASNSTYYTAKYRLVAKNSYLKITKLK